MKKKRLFIIFVLLVSLAVPVHTQDSDSSGTPHPYGITSSGLGTTITTEGSTFDITGGITSFFYRFLGEPGAKFSLWKSGASHPAE